MMLRVFSNMNWDSMLDKRALNHRLSAIIKRRIALVLVQALNKFGGRRGNTHFEFKYLKYQTQ